MLHAHISEVFNSIQGEGPYVGARQVFVRFQECQLHCAYCDTPRSRSFSELCLVEKNPGTQDFSSFKNPVSKDALEEFIRSLWTPSTKHISLTGGEPLVQADFIKKLDLDHPLYLETNSGFPEEARKIGEMIEIASCDVKLPEHASTDHYDELLKNEIETISVLNETSKTFVKMIILRETTTESIRSAIEGISSIDRTIPLILQPVISEGRNQVSSQLLMKLMDFAGEKLHDVRVIPQMHKMMGWL